jgi:hypothetical protein
MTVFYSAELAGIASLPVVKPSASAYAARLRRYRAAITLAAQATTDTIFVAFLPSGDDFAFGMMYTSVSLATSTVAIGIVGTTGKYRVAATFTTVDTPTTFGTTAQNIAPGLTAEDQVFITIAVAALPGAGSLSVEHYTSRP